MNHLIRVIDADLRWRNCWVAIIKVWHEPFGNTMQLDEISGADFFEHWLPDSVRGLFGDIEAYWDATHPYERDEHVAGYLASMVKGSHAIVHHSADCYEY